MAKKDKSRKKDKAGKAAQPREPGVLQSEITRASRAMRTFLTNALSTSGIYAGQDGVILALAEEDGLSAGAIAERLGVKPPTMTRTLARMEAQGFLRREADTSDGRQMRALLTDEGRRHVGAIQLAVRATENLAIAGLDDKDTRQFVKLLRKINRNLGQVEPDEEASGE
jgi:DNA-binding MarR family transcriptional regulator